MKAIFCALLLCAAAPAAAQTGAAQAAPVEPQRLTLAKATVDGIWPAGTYSKMMNQMMAGTMEQMMGSFMDMSEADMAKSLGVEAKPDGKEPSKETIREQIRKEDPHFEERMRIMNKVIGEEMGRIGSIMEPKMREGLTTAVAKRFTAAQLTDVNRFLATDTGRAFGSEMMMLWVDPDVFKSMMSSMPEMMKAMPAMFERIEKATAHLPKPKSKEKDKEKADAEKKD